MPKKNNVLVTGANGFVGINLVKQLSKSNYEIISLVKNDKNLKLISGISKVVHGDISDKNSLEKIFRENKICYVIHLAAIIRTRDFPVTYQTNVIGTKNIVELCKKYKIHKLLFLSTDFVMYKTVKNYYQMTKKLAERIIVSSGVNYIILRPSVMFGKGDDKNFISLIDFIKKYFIIPVPIGLTLSPIYVGNVSEAMINSLENVSTNKKVFYLTGKDFITFNRIFEMISNNLKLRRIFIPIPVFLFKILIFFYEKIIPNPPIFFYQVDKWSKHKTTFHTPSKNNLNVEPISFEEGLKFIV